MKNIRYIVLGLSLMMAQNNISQVVDYYSSANYGIALPAGETRDFISTASFRGFSFEFGRFFTKKISVGFLFAWNVFHENYPIDTYEFDNLALTGKLYRYINAFPLMVAGRYHFMDESQFRPYLGIASGAVIINKVSDMGLYREQNKNWHFGLAPGAGFIIELGSEAFFNMGARYNHAFKSGGDTHSWLSFQTGVTFIY
jgi:outer membrane protein W